MNKYVIRVQETLRREIIVDALNSEDAVHQVKEMYDNEDIILDSDDCANRSFDVIQSHKIAEGKYCPMCGQNLCHETQADYPYVCLECDENFYEFEV